MERQPARIDPAEFFQAGEDVVELAAGNQILVIVDIGDEVPCLVNVCAIGNPGEDCSALKGGSGAPAEEAPAAAAAPAAAPAPKAAPAGPAGAVAVKAPMLGTILKVNATVGASVKKGDVLCVLEAMKMENDICAPQDGVVASVNVQKGASVNIDDVLITLN